MGRPELWTYSAKVPLLFRLLIEVESRLWRLVYSSFQPPGIYVTSLGKGVCVGCVCVWGGGGCVCGGECVGVCVHHSHVPCMHVEGRGQIRGCGCLYELR